LLTRFLSQAAALLSLRRQVNVYTAEQRRGKMSMRGH
jgi:hypothetical protein